MNEDCNTFYDDLDHIFSSIFELLNQYHKSKILQNYFYDFFESTFYSNLILNFFNNLNDENIKEYNLSVEKIDELKTDFADLLKEIDLDLSQPLIKIDKIYYQTFKKRIRTEFSELSKLICENERLIQINLAKKYLNQKKR